MGERNGHDRMKRGIILKYLKTIVFSVFASVLVSVTLCYVLFFHNHTVDDAMPQYLVRTIEQYIQVSDHGFFLEEDGKRALNTHQLWMQIVDQEGTVVYDLYVPETIPKQYTNFELVNVVLKSNQLDHYTIYASALSGYEGYGVLIGCDSQFMTKVSYSFLGNGRSLIWKCMFVFFGTALVVIIAVSYRFSKTVTVPISRALGNIEDIRAGREVEITSSVHENMFSDVFTSIRELQLALKENEKMRAEWIANISHDIKTPLSTIKGYAELMGSDAYEFEQTEIQLYADQIQKAEETIEELLEELKISQRLAEGKVQLAMERVNLVPLIQECVEEAQAQSRQGWSIHFVYETEPEVWADRKLLKRCLLNIICNAYVHNQKEVSVEICLVEKQDTIKIEIIDNGKGISQEEMKHIFERYYRGTDSGKTKGTGLGLAIAKEVMTVHGGTIDVASTVGEGTKFTICMNQD